MLDFMAVGNTNPFLGRASFIPFVQPNMFLKTFTII